MGGSMRMGGIHGGQWGSIGVHRSQWGSMEIGRKGRQWGQMGMWGRGGTRGVQGGHWEGTEDNRAVWHTAVRAPPSPFPPCTASAVIKAN